MFIEIMAHILTIENMLMANYNISEKALVEVLKLNEKNVREYLNKIKEE